jgi:conjugative transfer pilus assembly protein TraH
MAQGLGSKISDTLLGSGASDNFMNARAEQINNGYDKIKDALKGVQKFFGSEGKKGAANMMGYGSFLKKAMETYKNPTSLSDEQWEAFVTALIGDVYGYTNKQKSTDGKDQTQFINFVSAEPIAGADTILKALAKGNVKIEAHIYKDNKDGEVYLKPTLDPIDVSFDDTNALIPYIQKKITDMIDKIKEHKSLSAEEIKFINSMPLPIYKIVNLESLENDASTSNLVAEYMGYDLAGKYLTYYVRHIKREINSLTSDPDFKATIDKTAFDKWSKKVNPIIKDLNKNINIRLQTLSSKLKNKVKILAYYQNLQKQLMQTNPIWKTGSLGK